MAYIYEPRMPRDWISDPPNHFAKRPDDKTAWFLDWAINFVLIQKLQFWTTSHVVIAILRMSLLLLFRIIVAKVGLSEPKWKAYYRTLRTSPNFKIFSIYSVFCNYLTFKWLVAFVVYAGLFPFYGYAMLALMIFADLTTLVALDSSRSNTILILVLFLCTKLVTLHRTESTFPNSIFER